MLVIPHSSAALHATLELERQLAEQRQFPAMHAGIHYGPALYREGDYLGTTINTAARLLQHAERHDIVVSVDVRREIHMLTGGRFEPLGMHTLKGLHEHVELFNLVPTDRGPMVRQIDPVCGMELAEDEVAARMQIGDKEHAFCSQAC